MSNHVLRLITPGAAHSIELYWAESSWRFEGWYINLQEPLWRTERGFATTDHALDIVVDGERQWKWKDEDDLDELVSVGYITPEHESAIRLEGLRMTARIESLAAPFCDGWEKWRPAEGWQQALLGPPP